MNARLSWRRYQRKFINPIRVSGHTWAIREGIIVRAEQEDGTIGFGDVAPVPWFPVENLEAAEGFFQMHQSALEMGIPTARPALLPCTEFAVDCALMPEIEISESDALEVAALLPAGEASLARAEALLEEGVKTFKWKIGVEPSKQEWAIAARLGALISNRAKLRLDANGGLSQKQLEGWGRALEGLPVEYIEQPLAVGQEELAVSTCQSLGLPLAFDESACTLDSLKTLSLGFSDAYYVIKPSQAGGFFALRDYLHSKPELKHIYSSAFESPIGLARVKQLVREDKKRFGAAGLGTAKAFEQDAFSELSTNPGTEEMEALWTQL